MSEAHFTTLAAVALKPASGEAEISFIFEREMSEAHFTTLAAVALKLASREAEIFIFMLPVHDGNLPRPADT
jgi:hypothetical protein